MSKECNIPFYLAAFLWLTIWLSMPAFFTKISLTSSFWLGIITGSFSITLYAIGGRLGLGPFRDLARPLEEDHTHQVNASEERTSCN